MAEQEASNEPVADRPDDDLVRLARAGDEDAFRTLFDRYQRWVADVAFRFCGHRDDALDVLQETFSYLFRKLPSLELRAKMTTFLYPVAKHLALDHKRKRVRRRALSSGDKALADVTARPVVGLAQAGRAAVVRKFVEGLPEIQRDILMLRFIDQLPYADIAAILEIPVGTVKSRLHNALSLARELAEDEDFFDRE